MELLLNVVIGKIPTRILFWLVMKSDDVPVPSPSLSVCRQQRTQDKRSIRRQSFFHFQNGGWTA